MALTTEQIGQLWTLPGYQRWLRRWWDEDFSVPGCEAKGIPDPGGEKIEFGGRTWDQFRVPFHDTSGNLNVRASGDRRQLADGLTQGVDFNTTDARGVICPRPLQISRNHNATYLNTAFAAFFGEFNVTAARLESFDLSNCFFLRTATFQHSRFETFNADGATFNEGLTINGKCSGVARFRKTKINGPLLIDGVALDELDLEEAELLGELKLHQMVNVQRINCAGLVCSDVSLLGAWFGSTSLIDCSRLQSKSFTLASGGSAHSAMEIRLIGAKVDAVSMQSGQIAKLDASGIEVSNDVQLENFGAAIMIFEGGKLGGALAARGGDFGETNLTDGKIGSASLRGTNTRRAILTRAEFGAFEGDQGAIRSIIGSKLRCNSTFSLKHTNTAEMTFDAADFMDGFRVKTNKEAAIQESNFDNAIFRQDNHGICIDLSGTNFSGKASFYGAQFLGIPQFHSVNFHENLSFQSSDFQPFQSLPADGTERNRRLAETERAFRSLRRRMEEMRNNQDARRFHAFEMRARRYRSDRDVGISERISSWLYEHTSSYGDSIASPVKWWIGLFAITTCFYWIWGGQLDAEGAAHAAGYSLQQVFRPFSAWDPRQPIDEWTTHLLTARTWCSAAVWSLLVRLTASFHAIASLTLLFLFGLALRRRFQVS